MSNEGENDDDAWWSTASTKQTSALEDEMQNFKTASDRQAERVLGSGATDAERKKFEDRLFSGMDKGLNFDKYVVGVRAKTLTTQYFSQSKKHTKVRRYSRRGEWTRRARWCGKI